MKTWNNKKTFYVIVSGDTNVKLALCTWNSLMQFYQITNFLK